jgi:hypothetical protein
LILALSLATVVGCSRGKGSNPPEAPPTTPEPPKPPPPKPQPKVEPDPEVEPVPGEAARLTLPKDGGAWPWAVGKAAEPPESQPVTFKGLSAYAVTGFAVRPEVNRAVVSIRVDSVKPDPTKKGPAAKGPMTPYTRVVPCDTATGKTLDEWHIPGPLAVLDLSPDGRSILATHPQPGKERSLLRLWTVAPDGRLKPSKWTPHTPPKDALRVDSATSETAGATEVRWAAFVGNDRIVSSSRAGQLKVFEADGLKPLATIDASPGRPAVSPDGTKVAFLVGSSVALLDVPTLKVTGTRWVGTPPPHPALAFSPDGTTLAVGGNGRVILLNLASGQLRNVTLPKLDVNDNGLYDKPFGWAGAAHLLADGRLHDPQLPTPVWEYTGAAFVQFRGWRVWAFARPAGGSTFTLRAHTLPDSGTLSRITAAKNQAGVFGLQPGTAVKLDLHQLPEERRPEAQALLEQRLREVGFVPDANATATVYASVDQPGTKPTVIYPGLGPYQYVKKPLRLRVVLNGKELWNDAWAVEPPLTVRLPAGVALADHLSKIGMGGPDYKVLGIAPLPTHLPGPNAPTAPLGTTDLGAASPAPGPDPG